MKYLLTLFSAVILLLACARQTASQPYTATAFATIAKDAPFTQAKLKAFEEAERKARDQILFQAMQQRFPNGQTLEDAAIQDSFIRAKLYDTIRTAKITDQTVDEAATTVTVTLKMDMEPLLQIVQNYTPKQL
jgi:hypothetical protein